MDWQDLSLLGLPFLVSKTDVQVEVFLSIREKLIHLSANRRHSKPSVVGVRAERMVWPGQNAGCNGPASIGSRRSCHCSSKVILGRVKPSSLTWSATSRHLWAHVERPRFNERPRQNGSPFEILEAVRVCPMG